MQAVGEREGDAPVDYAHELELLEARLADMYGISRVVTKCAVETPRIAQLVADSFNFHFPASADVQKMYEKLTRVALYLDGVAPNQDEVANVVAFRGVVVLKEGNKMVFAPLLSLLIKEQDSSRYVDRTSLVNRTPELYEIDVTLSQPSPTRIAPNHDEATLTVLPAFRLESRAHDIVSVAREFFDIHAAVHEMKREVLRRSETLGDLANKRDLCVHLRTDPFRSRVDDASVATAAHYKNGKLHRYYLISKTEEGFVVKPTAVLDTNRIKVSEWVDYQVRTSLMTISAREFTWFVSTEGSTRQISILTGSLNAVSAGAFRVEHPCRDPVVAVYILAADNDSAVTNVALHIRVLMVNKPMVGYDIEVPLPEKLKGGNLHHTTHDAGVDAFWISFKIADTFVRTHLKFIKNIGSVIYDKGFSVQGGSILKNQLDFIAAYGLQLQLDLRNKYEHNAIGLDEQQLEFE